MRRLPANMLEYLAITGCDDGALEDSSIEPNPDDPSMMRISTLRKTTALESKQWEGFSSDQL